MTYLVMTVLVFTLAVLGRKYKWHRHLTKCCTSEYLCIAAIVSLLWPAAIGALIVEFMFRLLTPLVNFLKEWVDK